jgi:hypothetical protein
MSFWLRRYLILQTGNALASHSTKYGSETWTLKGQEECRIRAADMKSVGDPRKYKLFGHKRNRYILQDSVAQAVLDQISNCDSRCVQRVSGLGRHRLPLAVINSQSALRTNTVCPLQRLQGFYIANGMGYEAPVLELR